MNNLLDFTGKTAIVTGGAVGIGLGIVKRLAEAGANVLIADLSLENGNKAKEELIAKGGKVDCLEADVSKEEDVARIVNKAVEVFGGVDILVNNAGIFPSIPLTEMPTETFDRILSVNLRSVFLTTKKVSEQMINQGRGGKIVNITSIDALHPSSIGLAAYDSSKHGVWGFTKNSALELSKHKILVNAVAPGGIATPGVAAMQSGTASRSIDMSKVLEAFLAKIPMGRMGEPDDIGKVVLFLASDMASYMTGAQIVVDGGFLLG